MFSKSKNWMSSGLWRPKNPHSLEHLKYLHNVLGKNQTVTEQNKGLLVEILRSISEILIWGDQNDSSVFDFFLEKNMLVFFLRFMRQKSGRYICVQLLQTLNILFENISNETSVYYLLSNNHINSIIIHKFDFSDEEVMAYYISFLKTLSLKLNKHTIHFFYNENTNDFALYTEAIKFFNHSETMVRIAVRTITLNVYKACRYTSQLDSYGQPSVDEKSMLRYIRDKTAAPYFSNLVWFIGNHVLELGACVRHDIDHNSRGRLSDLVAEHLDHLHYLNDILCLNIDALNEVLTEHFLDHLLLPLYVYSLTKRSRFTPHSEERPHVSQVVSLFLLSQVFLIIHHAPLVQQLADIILNGDTLVCLPEVSNAPRSGLTGIHGFVKPAEPLADTLDQVRDSSKPVKHPNCTDEVPDDRKSKFHIPESESSNSTGDDEATKANEAVGAQESVADDFATEENDDHISPNLNSTDEEKLLSQSYDTDFSLTNRPYMGAVFSCFDNINSDYEAIFALCLLYAVGHNNGINQKILDKIMMPTSQSISKSHYNTALIEKLIKIISNSCQSNSHIRLATLELSLLLLKTMVYKDEFCYLQDRHLAALEDSREEATLQLRNFYKVWEKSEEIFLDMFEDEYREMKSRPLNVEYLTMDASILLPPTGTPLTGIEFSKRLPCGEVEKARKAIRVFFHMHDLSLTLRQETELQLPLTKQEECVNINDILDLNNSDLIACTVIQRENRKERRFLVIDVLQLILVEPDSRKLGWGVVKFVGFLQDVEVSGDKEDSRTLHITIHKPSTNMHARPIPLLSARFIFDDHIRCMAAKQRLTKGRLRARQRKMQMIARLLELPSHIVDSIFLPSANIATSAVTLRTNQSSGAIPGRSHPVSQCSMELTQPSDSTSQPPPLLHTPSEGINRSVFAAIESSTTFQSARERTVVTNTRQLPRHLASKQTRPIPIRGGRPGGATRQRPVQDNILRVKEEAGIEIETTVMYTSNHVEDADEVTASHEAYAKQSLNPVKEPIEMPDVRGHASPSSSSDSSANHAPHEIPMIPLDDISKKMQSGSPRKTNVNQEHKKAHSESVNPRTDRRLSGSGSPRGRPKIITILNKTTEFAQKTDCSDSQIDEQEVTSFIKDPILEDSAHSGRVKTVTKPPKGSQNRSGSGSCPKTLTPALEPSLSLVVSCDNPQAVAEKSGISSPKLLPPTDPHYLCNVSDVTPGITEIEKQFKNSDSSQQSNSENNIFTTSDLLLGNQ